MDSIEVAKALSSLPLTMLLFLVLMGGYMGWWIYGSIHRQQIAELNERIASEKARAEKWETKYLDMSGKLDDLRYETQRVGQVVSGSPKLVDALQVKLQSLEDQLKELHTVIKAGK